MPVLGHENQISVQDEDTVPASAYVPVSSRENEYDSEMQLRYSYRLDPRPRHRLAFAKAFGCARVVFNDALAARQQARAAGQPYLSDAEVSARPARQIRP